MKLAITSILALATTAVAFTQGHSAFTRKATLCNMSEAADFVKAQTSGNDVSDFSGLLDPTFKEILNNDMNEFSSQKILNTQ
jgi:hypothetical protein